jgi:hypothetical protein
VKLPETMRISVLYTPFFFPRSWHKKSAGTVTRLLPILQQSLFPESLGTNLDAAR